MVKEHDPLDPSICHLGEHYPLIPPRAWDVVGTHTPHPNPLFVVSLSWVFRSLPKLLCARLAPDLKPPSMPALVEVVEEQLSQGCVGQISGQIAEISS